MDTLTILCPAPAECNIWASFTALSILLAESIILFLQLSVCVRARAHRSQFLMLATSANSELKT